MTKKEIIERFKKYGVQLYTAGIIEWDDLFEEKVEVDLARKDRTPVSSYPEDNLMKHPIQDSGLVCIDADGIKLEKLYEFFPSCKDTFATTTTLPYKKHFYLMPPKGKEFPILRKVKANIFNDAVDVISNGTVFEGHFVGGDGYCVYDMNDKDVIRCTDEEFEFIESLASITKKSEYDDTDGFEKAIQVNRALQTSLRADLIAFVKEGQYGDLERRFCSGNFAGTTFDDFKTKGNLHNFCMHILGILSTDPTVNEKLAHAFWKQFIKINTNITWNEHEEELFAKRFNSKHIANNWVYDKELVEKMKQKPSFKGVPLSLEVLYELGVAEDIADRPVVPLHEKNIIFDQFLHLFYAPSGYNKSFTVAALVADIDKDKFYLDFEHNPTSLKEHCEKNGITYVTPPNTMEELEMLLQSEADMSNALLIFDSFSNLIEDGNNDTTDTSRIVKMMHKLCTDYGATIIFIDHATIIDKKDENAKWNFKVEGNEQGKKKPCELLYMVQPKSMSKENWKDGVLLKCKKSRATPMRYLNDVVEFNGTDVFDFTDASHLPKAKTNPILNAGDIL